MNARVAIAPSKSSSIPSLDTLTEPIHLPETKSLIQRQVPLANLTSFRVGGPAEFYLAPRDLETLKASFAWARDQGLPITILGAGSNLLISDRGLPGLVICTRHLRYSHFDPETAQITAAAGEPIVRLAWQAAERGWSGLEWAVGIPGTVGGVVVMNAGAHQGCAADVVASTLILNPDGTPEILLPEQMEYRYRTSILQTDQRLVSQATFQLQPGHDPQTVIATTRQYLEHRHTTQPYHLPSCGSVFRNPKPYSAGWLIEQIGLKGYQIGGAQVAQRHANFILNCDAAKAIDILQLIRYVQQRVQEEWSIHLEPEVKLLGQF
jgi:UDP-N-acetylmuramate dehydrogenase